MTQDMFGSDSARLPQTPVLFEGHGFLDGKLIEIIGRYEKLFSQSPLDDFSLCVNLSEELNAIGYVFDYDEEYWPHNLMAKRNHSLFQRDEPDTRELSARETREVRRLRERNITEPLHRKANARRLWLKSGTRK